MFVDSQIEFSDAQAVTATAVSTNVYDTLSLLKGGAANVAGQSPVVSSNPRIDFGTGEDVYLVVSTAVAATAAGAATVTVTVESADDPTLTTNATVHATSGTLALAAFQPAGSRLMTIKLPSAAYRRYIGVRYTVATGPLTAGAFDAFVTVSAPDQQRAYKSGFTVQ